MDNTVGRLQSLFSPHQFDVIIGSLLGDARLECRSVGLRHPITARLRVHHGEKQKDYIFWKYEILRNLAAKEPQKSIWDNPKRSIQEISWYFHTKSLEEFGILYKYFYKDNIKILPKNLFNLLTPKMMAIWFIDDGCNTKESFVLNTHGFLKEEQNHIINFLKDKYEIAATLIKDRAQFKIRIGKDSYSKFLEITRPFIIPSMIYKIVNPRNDLLRNATELSH